MRLRLTTLAAALPLRIVVPGTAMLPRFLALLFRSITRPMLAGLGLLFVVAMPALGQGTCTVTSTADPNPTVAGTFRYCVTNAFSAGDDETVNFDLPPLSIITLSSSVSVNTLINVHNNITIAGPAGGDVTISGAGKYQILEVDPLDFGGTQFLYISNLTFTSGYTTGNGGAFMSCSRSLSIHCRRSSM